MSGYTRIRQFAVNGWAVLAMLCLVLPATAAEPERLLITTDSGTHEFLVEVARTDREKEVGLMYREDLAPDAGMLFLYATPQHVSMWMKNTLIPLDMLFLDQDLKVVRLARNTTPRSLTSIPSGQVVRAVLELRGGRAAELGIREGSRITYPVK
ncbi:MAG: DUF192 domain-containing protein [Gammaproteobacteria bacterium]|nr:DUF192 domain-containing protein [Gammaproteobacteria bacterium]